MLYDLLYVKLKKKLETKPIDTENRLVVARVKGLVVQEVGELFILIF